MPLPEVVLARRPSSRSVVEVATPSAPCATSAPPEVAPSTATSKRSVRIVAAPAALDDAERERLHLLARLLESEGATATTRAASAYLRGGFEFPEEQAVQLKLLEHRDEQAVCSALAVLAKLLDQQPPIQLPVFEQRLKRLEEGADNPETRARAAELRRALRT